MASALYLLEPMDRLSLFAGWESLCALHFAGWKTALVCADTFRAGAFDQLKQNASKARSGWLSGLWVAGLRMLARRVG